MVEIIRYVRNHILKAVFSTRSLITVRAKLKPNINQALSVKTSYQNKKRKKKDYDR